MDERVLKFDVRSNRNIRKSIHICQHRHALVSVVSRIPIFFFQSICSLKTEYSRAFIISRIIKSDVTIIFILLLALGLIANYCYWVFGVRACVREWVSIRAKICDCEGCDTCSCRSCSLNFKNRNVMRLFSVGCVHFVSFPLVGNSFCELTSLFALYWIFNESIYFSLAGDGGRLFFLRCCHTYGIDTTKHPSSIFSLGNVMRTPNMPFGFFSFLSFSHSTLLCKFGS